MKTAEKLAQVEAQIRKDIPRTIGHEIMLNDVLQWLNKKKEFSHSGDYVFSLNSSGYFSYKYFSDFNDRDGGIETIFSCKIDLTTPYLKDQSEELIDFLYNLIKD